LPARSCDEDKKSLLLQSLLLGSAIESNSHSLLRAGVRATNQGFPACRENPRAQPEGWEKEVAMGDLGRRL